MRRQRLALFITILTCVVSIVAGSASSAVDPGSYCNNPGKIYSPTNQFDRPPIWICSSQYRWVRIW